VTGPVPTLTVTVPLEGRATVSWQAANRGELERLVAWLVDGADTRALVEALLELGLFDEAAT